MMAYSYRRGTGLDEADRVLEPVNATMDAPQPMPAAGRAASRVSATMSRLVLYKGMVWTVAAFAVSQFIRLASNVVLARLLSPELFGLMQIVYTTRTGVELISDVGIGQNIIHDKDAEKPDFYNTAWTLQAIRGVILWLVFSAAALPIAAFFHAPILAAVIPIAGLFIVFNGLSSTSRFLLSKRMQYGKLTVFETAVAIVAAAAHIVWAAISPTIWALVFGPLFGAATFMVASHFILPDVRQRFYLSRRYVFRILSFGKWIFASSLIYFLSTNFDRLYFAKAIPLHLLGVYGIARALAELVGLMVQHLASSVVFPFIAAHSHMPRLELRAQLAPVRGKLLLIAALGFSLFAANADLVVDTLYDARYHAAGWMLPILLLGAWITVLANLNDSTLLGIGKPNYAAFGSAAKFAFLLVGLSLSLSHYGVAGAVAAVAVSDIFRYIPILIGQYRERFAFGAQDALTTLAVLVLIAFWEWLRWVLGFATSFDALVAMLHASGH
jgi:O-antigen/teichoic acid export membrane protein